MSLDLARIRCALSANRPSWFFGCCDGMLKIDVGLQRAHLRPEIVSLSIQVEKSRGANISLQRHCDRLHTDRSIIRLGESREVTTDELPLASSPVANLCKMLSRHGRTTRRVFWKIGSMKPNAGRGSCVRPAATEGRSAVCDWRKRRRLWSLCRCTERGNL
jgi:hypothetical protein